MHQVRKQRLIFICAGLLLLAFGLGSVLYALRDNLNLFYTPSEILQGKAQSGRTIRVGGLVQNGSVRRGEGVLVEFAVTDTSNAVQVQFEGILPDLFQEDEGVVAVGKLDASGVLIASEVLAKHDENYMPPEALEAIKRARAEKKQKS